MVDFINFHTSAKIIYFINSNNMGLKWEGVKKGGWDGERGTLIASEKNSTPEINRIEVLTVISPSRVSEPTDPHLIGESRVASLTRHSHHLTSKG